MFKRSNFLWELARKAVHLSSLVIVVGYTLLLNYTSERVAILSMTAVLLILLKIEYLRVEYKSRIAVFFDGLFRKREKNGISGAAFIVISSIICFAAFEYWVALLALFMTAFGDFFAALFGTAFGKIKLYKNKTLEGSLAGLLANLAVGFAILNQFPLLIVCMALSASLIEALTNKLDDNLTVPIFAGFIGQMLVYYNDFLLPPIDFSFLGLF